MDKIEYAQATEKLIVHNEDPRTLLLQIFESR